jgi:hypothetical protein
MITLSRDPGPMRYPLIVNDDGRDILVQADTDYPGVASSFGWYIGTVPASPRAVQYVALGEFRACVAEHDGTDGTIDCRACGTTAAEFIAAARDYLADNVGATADDPGYFLEDMTARTCNGHRPGEPCR